MMRLDVRHDHEHQRQRRAGRASLSCVQAGCAGCEQRRPPGASWKTVVREDRTTSSDADDELGQRGQRRACRVERDVVERAVAPHAPPARRAAIASGIAISAGDEHAGTAELTTRPESSSSTGAAWPATCRGRPSPAPPSQLEYCSITGSFRSSCARSASSARASRCARASPAPGRPAAPRRREHDQRDDQQREHAEREPAQDQPDAVSTAHAPGHATPRQAARAPWVDRPSVAEAAGQRALVGSNPATFCCSASIRL